MSDAAKHKRDSRIRRHQRIRRKVSGTAERPRLAVYRSNRHIEAQLVDDVTGRTLAAASTHEATLREDRTSNVDAARAVGRLVADRARAEGISRVVFDRGGFLYHGRVAALADAAREAGLEL
ncbi:MAG: 50S ribosomal protein L18 [Acidimicrobiia bacterium]|nr:50S ribosomal protein L18 [Acidimicrobiia bacterium]